MKKIFPLLCLWLLLAACSGPADDEEAIANLVSSFLTQTAESQPMSESTSAAADPQSTSITTASETPAPPPTPTPTEKPPPYSLPPDAVWFAPNFASADFTALFSNPAAWAQARQEVDIFQFYTQSVLNDPCPICGDNLLNAFAAVDAFRLLKEWGIAISLEVGAVKEWGCTGQRGYEVADFVIQNVVQNGGEVAILAMDEPRLYGTRPECNYSITEIAERTAFFINQVHTKYPDILIGDVEPYPHYSVAELTEWLTALEGQGIRPAFFHLDVDAERVRVEGQNVAADLQALQAVAEEKGIPFGVIMTSSWVQAGSDSSYYQSTMQWLNTVYGAIGRPQHVIFQSWQGPAASGLHEVPINLPENDPQVFSHTRLILEGLGILKP